MDKYIQTSIIAQLIGLKLLSETAAGQKVQIHEGKTDPLSLDLLRENPGWHEVLLIGDCLMSGHVRLM
jgi:hypothetical protein